MDVFRRSQVGKVKVMNIVIVNGINGRDVSRLKLFGLEWLEGVRRDLLGFPPCFGGGLFDKGPYCLLLIGSISEVEQAGLFDETSHPIDDVRVGTLVGHNSRKENLVGIEA